MNLLIAVGFALRGFPCSSCRCCRLPSRIFVAFLRPIRQKSPEKSPEYRRRKAKSSPINYLNLSLKLQSFDVILGTPSSHTVLLSCICQTSIHSTVVSFSKYPCQLFVAMNNIKSTDWDNSSSAYAKLAQQGPVLAPCERLLAAMNDASSFSSATTILDIGTGPGTAIDLLIKSYGTEISPSTRLIASDFSQAMVDATTSRKETSIAAGKDIENCWSRLEMKVMDAQNLSQVSPGSISHAMGSFVYFMLPDPRKGLLEAHRVLTEGGVFACTSWTMTMEWFQFLVLAAKRVRPDSTFTVVRLILCHRLFHQTRILMSELGQHDARSMDKYNRRQDGVGSSRIPQCTHRVHHF